MAALQLQQRDMHPNTIGSTEGRAHAKTGKRLADPQAGTAKYSCDPLAPIYA